MDVEVRENLNTDWWFDYQEFYRTVASKKYDVLVEVGVWKGHSVSYLAKEICKLNHTAKIYAVDLWDETYRWKDKPKLRKQIPFLYDIYTEIKMQSGVTGMINDLKGISWEVAEHFENDSVDFVFIDADHSYESVVKDINAWLPKIKKGGMISGHDYNNPCGVKRAVNELIEGYELSSEGVWFKYI